MSVEELIDGSEHVIHGKVVKTWAAWDGNRQFIWTHYAIEVEDSLKGEPASRLVVSEPGGTVGDVSMEIAGAPRYSPGEEVVVFTQRTPVGYLRTCGWGQGKFIVSSAADSSQKVVRSSLPPRALESVRSSAEAGKKTSARKGSSLKTLDGLSLQAFKLRLKELIAARADQKP